MRKDKRVSFANIRRIPLQLLAALMLLSTWVSTSLAVPVETATPITGEIEAITITTPGNTWSGGTMTVGGQIVILPANLLINLPNDYQSLQQLYANAPPACLATGETGLAKSDKCNATATGAQVSILANRVASGNVIAGQVDIFKALESVSGDITYIDYTNGYFRLDGILNDPTTGVMVRVNDPPVGPLPSAGGRHTVQQGPGCVAGNTVNCSPDTRFKIDPDNYTFAFITGYPACIPVTPGGVGDVNCPATNRPAPAANTLLTNPVPIVAADSRRFAPLQLGDSVKADGAFETIGGVTFLSASSVRVFVDLTTRTLDPNTGLADLTQPDYLIINEAGWDGAAYPAGRVRGRFLTNSSLRGTEIDYFSIHYDPTTNSPHERPIYTTQFNKQQGAVAVNGNTGVFDSQIRFDFMPLAKLLGNEPCIALRQGVSFDPKKFTGNPVIRDLNHNIIDITTFCTSATAGAGADSVDNFNLMVPAFREVMARSIRQHVATGQALDIHGRPAQSGQYKLPTVLAYGAFEDINLGMCAFPYQFMGTPWLRDRRLSPNGCVGVCEGAPQPLTPFPYEGIDPRVIAGAFGFTGTVIPTPNQMFAFVDAAGNMTGNLGFAAPANVGLPPITAVPALNLFPPIADEDAATTATGVPVVINVLANDIPVFGTIDPTTVTIASNPASGTAVVNLPAGTITYTPAAGFAGSVTFTYTVANNFGSVSNAGTVTITIVSPAPVANNDTATAFAGASSVIAVLANDTATAPATLNPATLTVSAPTGGTAAANGDGTVTYTAPASPGSYTFNYTVKDNSVSQVMSNAATVTINVGAKSTMTAPVNASVLTGVSQTFTWTNTGASIYQLFVGTAPGLSDIAITNASTSTSATITGIPTNGITIYVRLYSQFGGTWYFNDYTYTASGTPTPATMISPVAASTLAGASQTFTWNVAGANLFQLFIGTSPGLSNIAITNASTATSEKITGLPTNSSPVFVRLYSRYGTTWYFNDYTYTSAGTPPVPAPAVLVSPVPATTLAGSTQTFTWTNTGATIYQVFVGTTPGASDIAATNASPSTTATITGFPANGSTVNVRLFSQFNGTWIFNDYTYISGP
ncbi:MAG: cadherin-like domain-containing protein [Desulfuromonadales bacterium]|nr:cadherin-like domain-containing protein [Desulfuromonadales bacterium]